MSLRGGFVSPEATSIRYHARLAATRFLLEGVPSGARLFLYIHLVFGLIS